MRALSNLHAGLFIFTPLIPLAVQAGIRVLSPETTEVGTLNGEITPEGVTTN